MSECSDVVCLERVSRVFAGAKAVDDLSLKLKAGEVMGFLGTNGAGKTTTIKMMLGLLAPTSGTVKVLGGDPSDPRVRARIGYMPEVATYYPYLDARELLSFYGGICGLDAKTVRKRTDELLDAVGLADAAKRPLKTYSKGMLQRAGIAQALLNDPDLLVLDEPFTGLDPLARIHFRELLLDLKRRGKTVFFSSHELGETELLCDRVAIMKKGRCVYQGPVKDLAGDGADALEKFAASPPFFYDAVLMDIQMPRMTGFEAAEAIRSLEREDAKTVPVIAMSADIFEQSVNRATQSGMSGYLTKPLDMDVLYRELLRQLRLS